MPVIFNWETYHAKQLLWSSLRLNFSCVTRKVTSKFSLHSKCSHTNKLKNIFPIIATHHHPSVHRFFILTSIFTHPATKNLFPCMGNMLTKWVHVLSFNKFTKSSHYICIQRPLIIWCLTFKNASISPTAGMKSGLNGFILCSKSIVCGVYLWSTVQMFTLLSIRAKKNTITVVAKK